MVSNPTPYVSDYVYTLDVKGLNGLLGHVTLNSRPFESVIIIAIGLCITLITGHLQGGRNITTHS